MKTETSQPKHTQGEFNLLDKEAKLIPQFRFYEQRIQPESPSHVITVRGKTKEICEANAQRIVKCVNGEKKIDMHDELIEALKMANNLLKLKCGDLFKEWPESQEIERILKQAEGK